MMYTSVLLFWTIICISVCEVELFPTRCKQSELIDCSYLDLHTVPTDMISYKAVTLDLSHNKISKLYDGSFQKFSNLTSLSLGFNIISEIEIDAFRGLRELKELQLLHNTLEYVYRESYSQLITLQILTIQHNTFRNAMSTHASNITEISSLRSLGMDVHIGFTFLPEFKRLSNLSSLQLFSESNEIKSMKYNKNTFKYVYNLPITDLLLYGFQSIQIDTFFNMTNLQAFEINTGYVLTNPVLDVFRSLSVFKGRNMSSVKMTGNRFRNLFKLGHQHLKYLRDICLKTFVLRSMYITYIVPHALLDFAVKSKCLENLEISDNIIYAEPGFLLAYFQYLQSLRVLSLINNFRKERKRRYYKEIETNMNVRKESQYNIRKESRDFNINMTILLPKTLEQLYLKPRFSFPTSTNFIFPNVFNLRIVSFADNVVEGCLFTIYGLVNVRYFDMSGWKCSTLSENLLQGFPSLETYIARRSSIGIAMKINNRLSNLFRNNKFLKTIDFSMNSISKLPADLFLKQLNQLVLVNVSHNNLTYMPQFGSSAKNFKIVDLSFNQISSLSDTEMQQIDAIRTLKLYMRGNILQCTCSTLKFLKWVKSSNKIIDSRDLVCIFKNETHGTLASLLINLKHFEMTCVTRFWMIFSVITCTVLVLCIFFTIIYYRYRYAIEYFYIRLSSHLKPEQEVPTNCVYDAFIAYSHHDECWVKIFHDKLSEMGFNICLYAKNFIPGIGIAENIVRAIDSSRKVIFVVTENFLRSDWGSYEMEMTRMHAFQRGRNNMVIVVLKENLSVRSMPTVLKNMWAKVDCLQWPEDDNILPFHTQGIFYEKIKRALEPVCRSGRPTNALV